MVSKDSLVASSIVSVVLFVIISKIFGLGFFAKPPGADLKPYSGSFVIEKVIGCNIFLLSDKTIVKLIGVGCPIDQFKQYAKIYNKEAEQELKNIANMNREALRYVRSLVQGKEIILDFDEYQRDSSGRLLAYAFIPNAELIANEDFSLFSGMMVEYGDQLDNNEEGQIDGHIFLNAAILYAGYATPMNTPFEKIKYEGILKELFEKSKKDHHGLWRENTNTTK